LCFLWNKGTLKRNNLRTQRCSCDFCHRSSCKLLHHYRHEGHQSTVSWGRFSTLFCVTVLYSALESSLPKYKTSLHYIIHLKNFHIHTVHLDTIKVFYSPTDAQLNCLKNNIKIYIKMNIKTTPTYFGAVTPLSGSALFVLAKVTFVNIAY